jgi:hypothetical protein
VHLKLCSISTSETMPLSLEAALILCFVRLLEGVTAHRTGIRTASSGNG